MYVCFKELLAYLLLKWPLDLPVLMPGSGPPVINSICPAANGARNAINITVALDGFIMKVHLSSE